MVATLPWYGRGHGSIPCCGTKHGRVAQRQSARLLTGVSRFQNSPRSPFLCSSNFAGEALFRTEAEGRSNRSKSTNLPPKRLWMRAGFVSRMSRIVPGRRLQFGSVAQRKSVRLLSGGSRYRNSPDLPIPLANCEIFPRTAQGGEGRLLTVKRQVRFLWWEPIQCRKLIW